MIADHDLVVSLLPFQYHARVAEACIACGKDMVTTSYVQDDMKELHGPAIDAGVMLLNEIGVDPGIDHMTAMRIIDGVHARGVDHRISVGTVVGSQRPRPTTIPSATRSLGVRAASSSPAPGGLLSDRRGRDEDLRERGCSNHLSSVGPGRGCGPGDRFRGISEPRQPVLCLLLRDRSRRHHVPGGRSGFPAGARR